MNLRHHRLTGLLSILAFAASCIVTSSSQAVTVVQYDLFPLDAPVDTVPGMTDQAGITPLAMTRGGGLEPGTANNSFSSNVWATNAEGSPTVINEDGFVQIGFEADAGTSVALQSLIVGSRSSGSGPRQIGVFSSLDGFATAFETIVQDGTNFSNQVIDLTPLGTVTGLFAIRFQNVGGALTADPTRVGEMDNGSTWRVSDYRDPETFEFSNTQITAVPEPGTLAVTSIVCLAGVAQRRRRQNRATSVGQA